MKRLRIIALLQLFLLSNSVFAQSFWKLLPFPDSLTISCIAANKQGNVFVSTEN